jgi:hypothetical protein
LGDITFSTCAEHSVTRETSHSELREHLRERGFPACSQTAIWIDGDYSWSEAASLLSILVMEGGETHVRFDGVDPHPFDCEPSVMDLPPRLRRAYSEESELFDLEELQKVAPEKLGIGGIGLIDAQGDSP